MLKYIVGLACILICGISDAQDTVFVDDGFRMHRFPPGLLYFSSGQISPDSAVQVFEQRQAVVENLMDSNLGVVDAHFWFSTTVTNRSNRTKHLYLNLAHPHLRKIGFYRVDNGLIIDRYETGYQKSFTERRHRHRLFLYDFSLEPRASASFVILVDQQNSLDVPLSVWDKSAFTEQDYVINILYGLGLGFVSFCAIFSAAGALVLRNGLFVWYFLYLLSAILYGVTEPGFASQYLYPTAKNIDGPFSIHTSLYPFIFMIKFSQLLLSTKQHIPKVHMALNGIFVFMIGMVITDIIFGDVMRQYALYFLPVVFAVLFIGLALLGYCGIASLKWDRAVAILYLSGSGMVIITGLLSIPNQVFGVSTNWNFNPVLVGYLLEVLFLSVALLVQYRNLQREERYLAAQLSRQQQESYQTYIKGVELERTRIAGELHDDIGSRLSNLKRTLETATSSASFQLDEIIQDVRRLSHDLAPPSSFISGLAPLLQKLTQDATRSSRIKFTFRTFHYEERLTEVQVQQVYRICQEAIHNVIKHSEASQAHVQLFGHDDSIVLTIEDDGKGFDQDRTNGIGLEQMRIRAESIGASFEVSSSSNKGTFISVELRIKGQSSHESI